MTEHNLFSFIIVVPLRIVMLIGGVLGFFIFPLYYILTGRFFFKDWFNFFDRFGV